jgi:hypothetical protein
MRPFVMFLVGDECVPQILISLKLFAIVVYLARNQNIMCHGRFQGSSMTVSY